MNGDSTDLVYAPPPLPRAAALPRLRLLNLGRTDQGAWASALFLVLAVVIAAGYFFFLYSFWAPAPCRPGVDENGYLVGAKNIAERFSTGYRPADSFSYVGLMWVRAADGWYYPKYPFGTSLLQAMPLFAAGQAGKPWSFLVSPICTALAVLGMFFLTRAIAGSFAGILGMLTLGFSQTTLHLAHVPSSHAPDLCFVVWGMYLLIRWWQNGRWWLGLTAGLVLGYAVTIRYTEALLLFPLYPLDFIDKVAHPTWHKLFRAVRYLPIGPIGLVILSSVRWRSPRSWLAAAMPAVGWAIPVGILVLLNLRTLNSLTGYDATNESTGFTWAEFVGKWEFTAQQIYMFGLFFVAPLGIAGIALLFRRSWRLGMMFILWLLPPLLLYTAYYWGDNIQGTGYLRFFLTLFPAVVAPAMYLLTSATRGAGEESVASQGSSSGSRGSVAGPVAAGLVVAIAAATGLYTSLEGLERQHRGNLNLAYSAQSILRYVPSHRDPAKQAVVFIDQGWFPQHLQYLQFMGDCQWYATDAFIRPSGIPAGINRRRPKSDPSRPVLVQQDRIDYMNELLKGMSPADLARQQADVISGALSAGRPVYAVLQRHWIREFRQRLVQSGHVMVELEHWTEPVTVQFSSKTGALATPRQFFDFLIPWNPQTLHIYQIRPAPPTTAPATAPTSKPSTSPATQVTPS